MTLIAHGCGTHSITGVGVAAAVEPSDGRRARRAPTSSLALAVVAVVLAGCIPAPVSSEADCQTPTVTGYEAAPSNLKTPELDLMVDRFQKFVGTYEAELQCGSDYGGSHPVGISIVPDAVDKIEVVTAPPETGACLGAGAAIAHATLTILSSSITGLVGQATRLDATLSVKNGVVEMLGPFDPSYDDTLSEILLKILIPSSSGDAVGRLYFFGKWQPNGSGPETLAGRECAIVFFETT